MPGPAERTRPLPIGCLFPFLVVLWAFGLAMTVDYARLVVRAVRVLTRGDRR